MATRKKAVKKPVKSAVVKKVRAKKKQVKKDLIADFRQQVEADSGMEVVPFDSDAVIGHVTRVCPTGSLAIDRATGIGGLPFGRFVEVYGQPQCGKTTFTDHVLAQTQMMGGVGAVCDVEEKKDLKYAQSIGVNTKDLLLLQSPTGTFKTFESVLRAIEASLDYWIKNKVDKPITIVWDSLAATPTETELEDVGSKEPGLPARHMRRAMRRLTQKVAQANALVLVTNQQFEKIGFSRTPGVRRSTYGGAAIRYHATMRLELVRTGWLTLSNGENVGIEGIVKPFKNNLSPPNNNQAYAILYGNGFDNYWTLFQKLKEHRYITSGGAWYTLGIQGEQPLKFQRGFLGLGQVLAENPPLFQKCLDIYQAVP